MKWSLEHGRINIQQKIFKYVNLWAKTVPRSFCPTKNIPKYVHQKDLCRSFFEIFYCCIVTLPIKITSPPPHLTSTGCWNFHWNLLCKEMCGEERYVRKTCIWIIDMCCVHIYGTCSYEKLTLVVGGQMIISSIGLGLRSRPMEHPFSTKISPGK